MEVLVKNCSMSKTHISKMAYNHINNILACNIDGNDTILFYQFDFQNMIFTQIFKGSSKPPGAKISMTWSPDGKYLALGSANIQLWQLKDSRLKPVKTFHEEFIQIKIIQWSVDSLNYACGGISQRNTIRIRSIQSGKVKQLQLPQHQTISAISFDPYGKYLFLLYRNNSIEIYSAVNYEKQKTINLSPPNIKINPIKQIRTACWSPDFNNFVCPSLDDSRINVAINLSRNKDFKVKNIFMGHCTPISCCRFSPKLYKWQNQITAILALGDSSGNISIWRIGSKKQYPQPLILSNSLQNSMQVVQDIEWDDKGQVLFVNMMKKYINVIRFDKKVKDLGIQLSNDEIFRLIQQTYGSTRATDVNKRQIEVFDFNNSGWNNVQQEHKIDDLQTFSAEEQQVCIVQNLNVGQNRINDSKNINLNNQKQNSKIQQEVKDFSFGPIQKDNIIVQGNIIFQDNKNTSICIQNSEKKNIYSLNNNNCQIQVQNAVQSFDKHSSFNQVNQSQLSILNQPLTLNYNNKQDSNNEFIKLSQQKTMIGKNSKKKIQPAMMIRKAQISDLNIGSSISDRINLTGVLNPFNKLSNNYLFTNSMVQTFPSLYLSNITFNQKQIALSKTKLIQIKKLNKATAIQLIDLSQDNSHVGRRIFPQSIDFIYTTEKFIYVLNQQFLYIFDLDLNPKQLPLKVGYIHKFIANNEGQIYFINCDGYLIGFDHVNNINKTLSPVPLHLLIKQNFDLSNSLTLAIRQLSLASNSQLFITLQNDTQNARQKYQKYLYQSKINGWVKLSLQQGILQPGFSIKINDSQANIVKNFFISLCPSLKQRYCSQQKQAKQPNWINNNTVLSYQEQSIIYYKKYEKNEQRFQNSIVENFKNLRNLHRNNQFRKLIQQYFYDSNSMNYLKNEKQRQNLWQRLKKQVAGTIIQQFCIGVTNKQEVMALE